MEKELEDRRAVAHEVALEGVDVLVAFLPKFLGDELGRQALTIEQLLMHAGHQHLFVIRAVKDADMPASRQLDGCPPQEVVVKLKLTRRLEGMHVAALRVDA